MGWGQEVVNTTSWVCAQELLEEWALEHKQPKPQLQQQHSEGVIPWARHVLHRLQLPCEVYMLRELA